MLLQVVAAPNHARSHSSRDASVKDLHFTYSSRENLDLAFVRYCAFSRISFFVNFCILLGLVSLSMKPRRRLLAWTALSWMILSVSLSTPFPWASF